MMGEKFQSFGRTRAATRRSLGAAEAIALLKTRQAPANGMLAFGNGRSYGDSCHNDFGVLAAMGGMDAILSFDGDSGLMEAQAGVLLSQVIALAAPHGFFPAVVPGTQYVTLGGAIANDVHGKNHHLRGSFGRHVEALTLLRSDGVERRCSRTENPALFAATLGGMGLTGLILKATLRLMPVSSADIVQSVQPFSNLEDYFSRAEAIDRAHEYSVAWVDQLASGKNAGRGLLISGDHATESAPRAEAKLPLAVPFVPPVSPLNRLSLGLFNTGYRWAQSRKPGLHLTRFESFFFPLDGLKNWNRLYGPKGLFQHQSVVPLDAAPETVPLLLKAARDAGQASFLTVLKRFGNLKQPGVLSFAREGYTLTLDFPNRGARTLALLERLDAITADAGGAVNPYKDSRMPARIFAQSFPDWRMLEALRDPAFVSDFWRRTALRLPSAAMGLAAE